MLMPNMMLTGGCFFRKHGSSQNYEFSAQGGDERNSFFASLAYKKEEGKSRTSSLDGFMGRINAVHRSANNKCKWEPIFRCQDKILQFQVKEQLMRILSS